MKSPLLLPAPTSDCDCPGCIADMIRLEKAMTWPERRARARSVLDHRFPDIAHPMLCRWLTRLSERLDDAAWNPNLTLDQIQDICNAAAVDLAFAAEAATPNGGPNSTQHPKNACNRFPVCVLKIPA